jgi:hypothetical protein
MPRRTKLPPGPAPAAPAPAPAPVEVTPAKPATEPVQSVAGLAISGIMETINKKLEAGEKLKTREIDTVRTFVTASKRKPGEATEEIKRQLLELELRKKKGELFERDSILSAINEIRKTFVEAVTVMRESLPDMDSTVPVRDVQDELLRIEKTMQRMAENFRLEPPQ